MSVTEAVEHDLALLDERAPGLADRAEAALALSMAREIDSVSNSATSKSMCASRLLDALQRLHALVPESQEDGPLDDIRKRFARKR